VVTARYDSLAKIGGIRAPLLILHSPDDEVVPYEQGRALYEAASEPKRWGDLWGPHASAHLDSGTSYVAVLDRFLTEFVGPRSEIGG
jgi:fermentation-respiration switch protein FrsA (DUF1100 family)